MWIYYWQTLVYVGAVHAGLWFVDPLGNVVDHCLVLADMVEHQRSSRSWKPQSRGRACKTGMCLIDSDRHAELCTIVTPMQIAIHYLLLIVRRYHPLTYNFRQKYIRLDWLEPAWEVMKVRKNLILICYLVICDVGLGGLGIMCSPRDPRIAGSNPAEVDGFLQDVKILSRSPPGGTLRWMSRVWDFRLVQEPQAWKNRPLSKV